MKLKKLSLLFAAVALSLTACKDDVMIDGGEDNPNVPSTTHKSLHITAGIALPTTPGGRSATDDSKETGDDLTNSDQKDKDYEYGYDYENDVQTMILVIADQNDKYIAHTIINNITENSITGQKYDFEVTGELAYDDLNAAYQTGGLLATNQTVHLFAICNYTQRLLDLFKNGADADGNPATTGGSYDNWTNWVGTVIENPAAAGQKPAITNTIWANRSFLMTNAKIAEYTFPKDMDAWMAYADKSKPYRIHEDGVASGTTQPIYVERAAARIDFRDGSGNEENPNTYHLTGSYTLKKVEADGQEEVSEAKDLNVFDIQLTRMSLVNMSKNFYYLRRVSPLGTDANSVLCGVETSTSGENPYVVDTDAAKKSTKGTWYTHATGSTGFNFALYDEKDASYARGNWYTDQIEDVLKGANDNWGGKNTYQIWRYVTENTIPSGIENQVTAQSTGVVFKGKILAGEDINANFGDKANTRIVSKAVADALENVTTTQGNSPILYSFEGNLYAGVADLVSGAMAGNYGSPIYTSVGNILQNWYTTDKGATYKYAETAPTNGEALTVEKADTILNINKKTDVIDFSKANAPADSEFEGPEGQFMELAPAQVITIYKASNEKVGDSDNDGWGYYCYYFYWNRHNDNNKSGEMGVMEFATVRNNVYKLAVTGINQLGHPRITKYDPDPEEDDTPDEKRVRYITVQVDVLPWVVRVNDIEF